MNWRNVSSIFLVIAAIAVFSKVFLTPKTITPQEQAAVELTWKQYKKGSMEMNSSARLKNLKQIDVSRTPASFRQAWSRYIEAADAFEAYTKSTNANITANGTSDERASAIERYAGAAKPVNDAGQALSEEFDKFVNTH